MEFLETFGILGFVPFAVPLGVSRRARRRSAVIVSFLAVGALVSAGLHSANAATTETSVVRINAGGGAFTDSQGRQWSADQYYSDGWTYTTDQQIKGAATADQPMYNSERAGMGSYNIPVTNGTYTVKLYLAEIYPGEGRTFSATAEGQSIIANVNLEATYGAFTAATVSRTVTVNDGSVDLGFSASVDNAKVSGIELLRQATTTTTTAKPTTTTLQLTQPVAAGTKPSGVTGTWRLVFNDEFNTTSLNTNVWTTCGYQLQSGCRPTNSNELGFITPNNIVVSGGAVQFTAKKQAVKAPNGQAYNYTTGNISTAPDDNRDGTFSYKYGYSEARIKVAAGAGMWSAFWLGPQNLVWPPEVDVTEQLGMYPTKSMSNIFWKSGSTVRSGDKWIDAGTTLSAGYHTFGLDWEPTGMKWYIDGKLMRTATSTEVVPPSQAMYPILNLAVGGWGGPVNATLPSTMSVDWVRIWQK